MAELFLGHREVDRMELMAALAVVAAAATPEVAGLALRVKEIMAAQKLGLAQSGLAVVAQALLAIATAAVLVVLVALA